MLRINPSTTRHKELSQQEFHTYVYWCCVVVFCMIPSSTVSISHCSLLDPYLWVHLFPTAGRALAWLLGWLWLLQASQYTAQSQSCRNIWFVSSDRLIFHFPFKQKRGGRQKNASVCGSRREVVPPELSYRWRGWLTAAWGWALGFGWLLACVRANDFFSKNFNEFCVRSVAQQVQVCQLFVF